MSQVLASVAADSLQPAHASYYGDIDSKNPVIIAGEKELNEVLEIFSKKSSKKNFSNETLKRGSNLLFQIWNKYEPRWPTDLFYERMVSIGYNLLDLKSYKVALYQCFQRYLITRYKVDPYCIDHDINLYKNTFFPEKQSKSDHILTGKSLIGMSICKYRLMIKNDIGVERKQTLDLCVKILHQIRCFMQCLMIDEKLCWLLYNSTIVIHEICKNLTSVGHSQQAIKFLIWASTTMESCVPLLTIKYLEWRTTLYSSVCFAYYDCNGDKHAQDFASRALHKIKELKELTDIQDSESNEQVIFNKATHEMASAVFKRLVFESRKRPKGLLRPKVKANLKETAQSTWPRTQTEKFLFDMFKGSSAQFLAIIDALNSPHKRVFQTNQLNNEHEFNEVVNELFFAAKEIIAGGGGNSSSMASSSDHSTLVGVRSDMSMRDLSAYGYSGVTLSAVVKLTKLAFSYEQWATYNNLLDCTLIFIKKNMEEASEEVKYEYNIYELCLALLLTTEKVIRQQHFMQSSPAVRKMTAGNEMDGLNKTVNNGDDILYVAETLLYCIKEPSCFDSIGLDKEQAITRDMLLDVTMILWYKCKPLFSKGQMGLWEDSDFSTNSNFGKWFHTLTIVHMSLNWMKIGLTDPVLVSEVALKLSLALEAVTKFNDYSDHGFSLHTSFSSIGSSPFMQLNNALHIIKDALNAVDFGKQQLCPRDSTRIVDLMMITSQKKTNELSIFELMINDLRVELLSIHHRISLKLISMKNNLPFLNTNPQSSNGYTLPDNYFELISMENLLESVGSSPTSKSLLFIQQSLQIYSKDLSEAKALLKKAFQEVMKEEKYNLRLYNNNCKEQNISENNSTPSAPILLSRSCTKMIFKPPVFNPANTKVCWWKIFGRKKTDLAQKVRLNDFSLTGTGEEIPAGEDSVFVISNLEPNKQYMFAVAAYTNRGKLIGASIGKTSQEIISSHATSILTTYGYLAQVSYTIEENELCKKACSTLWNYFISSSNVKDTKIRDYQFQTHHLNRKKLMKASPILLRHLMTSVQINIDIIVQEKGLLFNHSYDEIDSLPNQLLRLECCQKMLVAIELANWLNDSSSHLQCIIQTYGLIAPIIQANILSSHVMEIILKCLSDLKIILPALKTNKTIQKSQSINQVVACMSNYVAKVASSNEDRLLALSSIQIAKDILNPQVGVEDSKKTSRKKQRLRPQENLNEIMMLERRFSEIQISVDQVGELKGTEDSHEVYAKLYLMQTTAAFRELTKFKKRYKYLEYFVYALKKAFRCGNTETAITWSKDVLQTLHRRAEIMNVYKPLTYKKTAVATNENNNSRKYAAAVVEFVQATQDKSERKKNNPTNSAKNKVKKFRPFWKRKGGPGGSPEQEEEEQIAAGRLTIFLIPMIKNWQKKKILRKLTIDETPWRSDFNRLVALMYMQMYFEKLDERRKGLRISESNFYDSNFFNHELWSFQNSGKLVSDWTEINDAEQTNQSGKSPRKSSTNKEIDPLFMKKNDQDEPPIEEAARLAITYTLTSNTIDEATSEMALISPPGFNEPSTRTILQNDAFSSALKPASLLENLRIATISFKRSLVLAHRGRHWILLQNNAHDMFWCFQKALQYAEDGSDSFVISSSKIKSILCKTVATCADLLLDMMMVVDCGDLKENNEDFGGSRFNFERKLDYSHLVDRKFCYQVIITSIHLLHNETRWEELVDICLRFEKVTNRKMTELIAPVTAYAQHQLSERIKQFNNQSTNKYAMKKKQDLQSEEFSTEQEIYEFGERALQLSCVPVDFKLTMKKLKEIISKSQYVSRSLKHSRNLLALYLASHQFDKERTHNKKIHKTIDENGSKFVEMAKAPIKPTEIHFKTIQINTQPLTEKQANNLINSYLRTIELLKSSSQFDLCAQAYNELADIYCHQGNIKTAQKYWNSSLDQIFKMEDAINKWRDLVKEDMNLSEKILEICGFWGCFHAITVAGKIGEFCLSNTEDRIKHALLISQLVCALFKSSLPHPINECDYLLYELIPQQCTENIELLTFAHVNRILPPHIINPGYELLNAISIFSDQYRSNLPSVIASLHWACNQLIEKEYFIKSLPLLTLYQYFATFHARDVKRSVLCRCLKLQVLTKMKDFQSASQTAISLLYGCCLPHSTDVGYAPIESYPINSYLDSSKPFTSPENLQVLEILSGKRVSQKIAAKYGPQLTCEVSCTVSYLLITIASVVDVVPQKPTMLDLKFVSSFKHHDSDNKLRKSKTTKKVKEGKQTLPAVQVDMEKHSLLSVLSSHNVSNLQINHIFTSMDKPLSIELFKGMLLAVAENITLSVLRPLENTLSTFPIGPAELWLIIQGRLNLLLINRQNQMSSLSACQILKAMKYMQDSKIFNKSENKREKTKYKMIDSFYESRLNSSLWLECHYQFCLSLSLQVKIDENNLSSTIDDKEIQMHVAEGSKQADSFKDLQTKAYYLILESSLDGVTSKESQSLLKDAIDCFDQIPYLSEVAKEKLAEATLRLVDAKILTGEIDNRLISKTYEDVISLLLMKSVDEWEYLDDGGSSLALPLKNPYSSNHILLVHSKLRYAISLQQRALKNDEDLDLMLKILKESEQLCKVLYNADFLLAEITYYLCKFLRVKSNHDTIRSVHTKTRKFLSEMMSNKSSSLELIRYFCLEMALIEIKISENKINTNFDEEASNDEDILSFDLLSNYSEAKKRAINQIYNAFYYQKMDKIRASLFSNSNVTDEQLTPEATDSIPDFAIMDTSSHYNKLPTNLLFERIFHDDDDTRVTLQMKPDEFDFDSFVDAIRKQKSPYCSWLLFLKYKTSLQRKLRVTTNNLSKVNHAYPSDVTRNVMTPLNYRDYYIRFNKINDFLSSNFGPYSETYESPPPNLPKSFVCLQWYRNDVTVGQVTLIWAAVSGTQMYCGTKMVPTDQLLQMSRGLNLLKQQTEENFHLKKSEIESKTQPVSKKLQDQWKDEVKKIASLLSTTSIENLEDFVINLKTVESLSNLLVIGGFYDKKNPVFKLLVQILCSHFT